MMPILTMADVVSLDVFQSAVVAAGGDRLAERVVRWVSVIETPVEDFVRQDEFVLTTCVGFGDDSAALGEFVGEIMGAGASGLAIATGRHIQRIPDNIKALANEAHFPILDVPWKVRFAEIIQSVYAAISLAGTGSGGGSGTVREALLRMSLGEGLDEVLEALGQGYNGLAAFYDAYSGAWRGMASLIDWCHAHFQLLHPHLVTTLDVGPALTRPPQSRAQIGGRRIEFYPVVLGQRWVGTVVAESLDDGEANMMFHDEGERLTLLVSLALAEEEAAHQIGLRMEEDLVWNLAKGTFKSWDEATALAAQVNRDLSHPHAAIIGRLADLEAQYHYRQTVFASVPRGKWEADLAKKVQRALSQAFEAAGWRALVTYQRGEWIGYAFTNRPLSMEAVRGLVASVEHVLSLHEPQAKFSWGIAAAAPGLSGFHQSYQNARTALDLGVRRQGVGHVFEYEHVQYQAVLSRFIDDPVVRDVVQAALGGLVDYDRAHDSELVETLSAYLRHRTNVSVTARALHLHRQSLLYRLGKIELLTGRSLDDSDDLFLLELCVRLTGLR